MKQQGLICMFLCIPSLMVFVSSCSNDADPNPRRLIKSIGGQTFDYDNNSNLVEIRNQNNIVSKYTYDAQNRLETAINYNYSV